MVWLRFLVQQSTSKKNYSLSINYLTYFFVVYSAFKMQSSNNKILEKVLNLKSIIIKTSIFTGLAAYWGIILVGTLITFS
jgi:hypothetical protein